MNQLQTSHNFYFIGIHAEKLALFKHHFSYPVALKTTT